jgi:hypothetical protein
LKINFTSRDITAICICSALYAVFGILTGGISFFGIGFLPAVVIPAVFAVLYGPWVGGISGAIGIFIRDLIVHGNAPLSLVAGVPPNFILFFLIGYLCTKTVSLKKALICVSLASIGLLISSIVFLSDINAYTSAIEVWTGLTFKIFLLAAALILIASLAVIAVVSICWREWRSYVIGTVVGLIAGCLLLSVTVWIVSPLFTSILPHVASIGVLPIFIWTIATEIPFILLLGPTIIKSVQKIFPTLRYSNKNKKGENIAQKNS